MKKKWLGIIVLLLLSCNIGHAQAIKINYVNSFNNEHHPEIIYWFFSPDMLPAAKYKAEINNFAKNSKYTMIFLTARHGVDFYDIKKMHPILKQVVDYAHKKGLKIGLQLWKNDKGTLLKNTERLIQEGKVVLNNKGQAFYRVKATGARNMNEIIKSKLFKIYAFKQTTDGFYDPSKLKDITSTAKAH